MSLQNWTVKKEKMRGGILQGSHVHTLSVEVMVRGLWNKN